MKKLIFVLFAALLLALPLQSFSQTGKKMPVIGISSTTETNLAAAPLTYVNAVKKAGGVPLIIPMTTDDAQLAVILKTVDAIVMTGGEDIDPQYFGEEPHRNLGEVVPERDAFDYKLIKEAVAAGLPVLGICRGEQIMNVVFGGTLYQDIPTQVKDNFVKHYQKAPRYLGTHSVSIEKGSLLHKQMAGQTEVRVNTYHHQSVKDVAPGFKVTAYSKDGIVEAIEMIGNDKVWGVQFHPEGLVSNGDDTFLGIFRYLIEKAGAKK